MMRLVVKMFSNASSLKDPFASAMESASALHCPDAKRNLLDDLNRLDMTEEHMGRVPL